MLVPLSASLLATTLYSSTISAAATEDVDPAKSSAVKNAITRLDAYNLLSASDFIYDFNTVVSNPFDIGSVLSADAGTWPILAGGRQTIAQINLSPCAMLSPHNHQSTKIVVAVSGTTKTFMVIENGATPRTTLLTPGKMTVFPRGAMHTMTNEGCGNAVLYSFFDSDDPGTVSHAQAFMAVGPDIGLTVMPFIQQVNNDWNQTAADVPAIGMGAQNGTGACLRMCGLA